MKMGKCEQSLPVVITHFTLRELRAYSLRCVKYFPKPANSTKLEKSTGQQAAFLIPQLIGVRTIRRVLSHLLKFETVVFTTSILRKVYHGLETIVCIRFVVPAESHKQDNRYGAHSRSNNGNSAVAVISLWSSRGTC